VESEDVVDDKVRKSSPKSGMDARLSVWRCYSSDQHEKSIRPPSGEHEGRALLKHEIQAHKQSFETREIRNPTASPSPIEFGGKKEKTVRHARCPHI
jgi:hypothetical protein